MAPEVRLTEAIDRMLEGATVGALPAEERELVELAGGLRDARAWVWPVGEAALKERILKEFRARVPKRQPLGGTTLGAVAAGIVAALLLATPGPKAPSAEALILGPNRTHGAHAAAMTYSAAAPASSAAAPAAPASHDQKTVDSTGNVQMSATSEGLPAGIAVMQPPPRHVAAQAVGFGMIAVALPKGALPPGGAIEATSLASRSYRVRTLNVGAGGDHPLTVLFTAGLAPGWYRLSTSGGASAVFVPSRGAVRETGWISMRARASLTRPFALRFTPSVTLAAFDPGAAPSVGMRTPRGVERPLWSRTERVDGRPAVVFAFDPTPLGRRSLTFVLAGGQHVTVVLP